MRCLLWIVLALTISDGNFTWTVDNETGVTNYFIDCAGPNSGRWQWDLTVAAKNTAPLYAGNLHALGTAYVTYGMPGSYSCKVSALKVAATLAQSNTVTLNQ